MIFYANIVNTLYNRNKVGYNQKRQLIRLPFYFFFAQLLNHGECDKLFAQI